MDILTIDPVVEGSFHTDTKCSGKNVSGACSYEMFSPSSSVKASPYVCFLGVNGSEHMGSGSSQISSFFYKII